MKGKNSKKTFKQLIDANVNNFNGAPRVAKMKNDPPFSAQFDITFNLTYASYEIATQGWLVDVDPATLPAAVQNVDIPAVFAGHTDFASGYKYAIDNTPVNVWEFHKTEAVQNRIQITINDTIPFVAEIPLPAQTERGDVVIVYRYVAGGFNYFAIVTVKMNSGAYAKLLSSLSSDVFRINAIRYTLNDNLQLDQYNRPINLLYQTLFGKSKKDSLSPTSYKNPEQQQDNVIDIPIEDTFDKNTIFTTMLKYAIGNVTWSVFVQYSNKFQ